MQRLDGQLVLSPTDLTHHQECAHLTRLDLGVAAGEWAAPDVETPGGRAVRLRPRPRARAEVPGVAEGRRQDGGRDRRRLRRRGTTSRGGRDRRGDAPRRRRRLPGHVLRRRLGRPGRLPAPRRQAVPGLRRLVLRDRRHQARPQAQGRRAAADGHLRRAAHRAAGRGAGVHPRRHRGRRIAAVAADRRRRLRPPRAGPAGGVRGRAAGDRSCADRLLRAVPLGREVHHRAAAGRRPRPGRADARRPAGRAAGGGHRDAGRAGDGDAGAAEVVRASAPTRAPGCSSRRPSSCTSGRRDSRRARCSTRSPASGCCACRRRAPATSTSTSRATPGSTTARASSTSPAWATGPAGSPRCGRTTGRRRSRWSPT